jgi:hypothetical protein
MPNHVPVAGTCRVSAAVGRVKWNVAPRPLFVRRGPQTASVRLDNGAAESHPAALGLGGEERVKDLLGFFLGQSHAGIADRDQQLTGPGAVTPERRALPLVLLPGAGPTIGDSCYLHEPLTILTAVTVK